MVMMRIGMSITAGSGGGCGAATVTTGTTDGGGADSRPPSTLDCGLEISSSGMRSVVRPRRRPGEESRAPERDAGGGSLSESDGVDGTAATGATSVVVESGPSAGGAAAAGSSGFGAGAARRSSLTPPPSA
jgi:hypothetical protein